MRLKLIKGLNCQKNKQAKKKAILLYNCSVVSLFVEHFKMDPMISYVHKSSDWKAWPMHVGSRNSPSQRGASIRRINV